MKTLGSTNKLALFLLFVFILTISSILETNMTKTKSYLLNSNNSESSLLTNSLTEKHKKNKTHKSKSTGSSKQHHNIEKNIHVDSKKHLKHRLSKKENPYKNFEILQDESVNAQDLPFNIKGDHTNFLGLKVNAETELLTPPFRISRCDQSVNFSTEYIPDLEDYLSREEGFIIINAHYFHLFTKDKSELIGSILLSQSLVAPSEPRGAKDCIQINGGNLSSNIIICFKDTELKNNIYSVLDSFSDCRGTSNNDDSVKEEASNTKIKIIQNCSLIKKGENPAEVLDKHNEDKLKTENLKKMNGAETWSPAPNAVPGSGRAEEIIQEAIKIE